MADILDNVRTAAGIRGGGYVPEQMVPQDERNTDCASTCI